MILLQASPSCHPRTKKGEKGGKENSKKIEIGDTLPYAFAISVVLWKMETTTMHMIIRNQLITGM